MQRFFHDKGFYLKKMKVVTWLIAFLTEFFEAMQAWRANMQIEVTTYAM